jgi:hypothetical protein
VIWQLLRRGHKKTDNNAKALVCQFQKATAHSFTACNKREFSKDCSQGYFTKFKFLTENMM